MLLLRLSAQGVPLSNCALRLTYLTFCDRMAPYYDNCPNPWKQLEPMPRKLGRVKCRLKCCDLYQRAKSIVKRARSTSIMAELVDSHCTNRIIHKLLSKEEQYVRDLDLVESVFIKPLRKASPPVIPHSQLEDFIDEVFGNILDLRECNRRLLEVMAVRQREQAPIIQRIGDIFLDAATEFRLAYPIYVGHHPIAEKRVRDELESNPSFRLFIEVSLCLSSCHRVRSLNGY